jgi:hypothetical protein
MTMKIEVSTVSIASEGDVRVAFPAGMSELELGLVLQGMGMALIRRNVDSSSGERARLPGSGRRFEVDPPQAIQGKDRKTLSDRRKLPRRKVTKRTGRREELECGHVIEKTPSNWKKHKSRACSQCPVVKA